MTKNSNNEEDDCGKNKERHEGNGSIYYQITLSIFIGILLLFAQLRVLAKIVLFIVAWWFLLMAAQVHPAFFFFEKEKRWISGLDSSGGKHSFNLLIKGLAYFAYWPVFIDKKYYFWSLLTGYLLYSLIKNFWGLL